MTKDDNKGDISRGNLQRYDIFFHPVDNDAQYDPIQLNSFALPDHIESVCEGLLEMKNVIADCWEGQLHQEAIKYAEADMGPTWASEPPISAFVQEEQYQIDKKEHSAEWEFANASLVRCLAVAKRARNLLKFPEAEWNFFWRQHVFCLFSDEAWKQPGFNSALDEWSLYGEVTWTGFHDWIQSRAQKGAQDRTMPKPDLTYAFPVQHPHSSIPRGFARDEFLQTFSLEVLGSLIEQGIVCTPTTTLRQWLKAPERAEISDTDRTCFPWAIVEMKRHPTKDKASIERCYCQAANGAAAALEMQAQLFQESSHELLSHQPPIVTFTCIGPIVKVWLTYQDEAGPCQIPKKRMVCIWTTSVQLTWGVVSLRAIIMNMHTWASRLLKPKLQGCIYRFSQTLKKMGQDGSGASSSQPSSYRSGSSPGDTPGSTEVSGNESELASSALASSLNLLQTPQRQQSSASKDLQEQTPTGPTSSEPQSSPNGAQSEVPELPGHTFHASDWTPDMFDFGPSSNLVKPGQPDSLQDSPISLSVGGMSSDSPIKSPRGSQQGTPTSLRWAIRPRTPQTLRRTIDKGSPPAASASPNRSAMETPVAMTSSKDTLSTEAEYARPDSGNQRSTLSSPSGDDVSEPCVAQTEKVTKKLHRINTTSPSDCSHAKTGNGVVASSSAARTQDLIGMTTGEVPGQNPFFRQLSTGARDLLFGSTTVAGWSTKSTNESEKSKSDTSVISNGTGPNFFNPAQLPIDVAYPELDLRDMSSEICNIAARIFGHSQPASEDSCRRVDTRQDNELDSERSRVKDTPPRHKVHIDRISPIPIDAETTPRPRMKSADDIFNSFDISHKTGHEDDNTMSSADEDTSSTSSDSARVIGGIERSGPGVNAATTHGGSNDYDHNLCGSSQSSDQRLGTSTMATTNGSVCSSVLSEASNYEADPNYVPSLMDDSCSDAPTERSTPRQRRRRKR